MATDFETELEIFRTEEETAQQYFFAYLSVRSLAASDDRILAKMNENPLFWMTTHHAMLLSAFVALGRIFDQQSKHNIDRLIGSVAKDLGVFARASLMARKQAAGLSPQEAARYVSDAYELTVDDVRGLRKRIADWRKIYEDRYRDVRHKVFAHKSLSTLTEINALLAKTNVEELKALFSFLSALYSSLWDTFHNGRNLVLGTPRDFVLPPDQPLRGKVMLPGETVYREGYTALKSIL